MAAPVGGKHGATHSPNQYPELDPWKYESFICYLYSMNHTRLLAINIAHSRNNRVALKEWENR